MYDSSSVPAAARAEFEDAVRRFEVAWQGAARPDIVGFLVDPGQTGLLTELVHVDLEYRLRAGEPARVEEYLARYPALAADRETVLELVVAEYELRRRGDPSLSLSDFQRRFPQFGRDLPDRVAAATVAAGSGGRSRPEAAPDVPGYEVIGPLGRGGMGVVYEARQLSLDRRVALKFLPADCARDPVWLERFRREALTASALNHPNICTIYDTGEAAGRPFLSMELVDGHTLAEVIARRPAADEVARLVGQVARALAAAHAAGVVHRDVKPHNVMVRGDGIVKVLDFGLARRLPAAGPAAGRGTDPGTRVGTVLYMSPEQGRGEPVGTASDVYSLGVVVYELAAGRHPYPDLTGAGPPPADELPPLHHLNPEIPPAVDDLVRRMMAHDPATRPPAAAVAAAVAGGPAARRPSDRPAGPVRPITVGRAAELATLREAYESAAAGRGSVVCVTGEPGLGKTTLVEDFLAALSADARPHALARGRCSERLAGTEAYLPFLEALDDLLRADDGPESARLMRAVAPTWYVELVPLAADDPALARMREDARNASQERRKREFAVFLVEAAGPHPLVLFLDDVHWADPSSVDLLAYLGGRCADLRLLVVLTYRPSDLAVARHPFGPVKLDLQARGVCREVGLPFLNRGEFDRYLALTFPGHEFPDEVVAVLHARTEGNPLFMVDLLRYLRDRGVIVQDGGRWSLARAVPDLQRELPESVRGMVRRTLDQLSPADSQLLTAASTQGPEFDSAVVAEVLARDAADVEERLAVLEQVHVVVRRVREHVFPDGTPTVRYGFVHVLYQNALYAALQPTRKASWSAAAARSLEAHYGEKSAGLAAELAMLFEVGREPARAAEHYGVAAENAARVFAHHESVALARRGLALIPKVPDTPDRARRELALLVTLGTQLQVSRGYAFGEVESIYARARALCDRVDEAPRQLLVHWGLWMYYEVGSHFDKSLQLADQLFVLATNAGDTGQLLQAHLALSVTTLSLGDPASTYDHAERGTALYDPERHGRQTYLYGQEPGVGCLAFGSVALWLLGYPDRAVERARRAVALGERMGHPTSHALAMYLTTMVRQYRREPAAVQDAAEVTTAIATEHGLALWLANGLVMRGWARAEQGASASGVAMLRQGMADWLATGAETHRTYFLGLLAEALGRAGQIEEALAVLTEALAMMRGTGTVFHGAELHRLQGEFLLLRDAGATREADACFHEALALARQQRARSLELRAVMSLARLRRRQGRAAEVRPLLAETYGWFTEGFDTPDLRDARALLDLPV